jgi:hypothetical protein
LVKDLNAMSKSQPVNFWLRYKTYKKLRKNLEVNGYLFFSSFIGIMPLKAVYANRVTELLAHLYTPKISSMEYNHLCIMSNEIKEREEATAKAVNEVFEMRRSRLPIRPSTTPDAYAKLNEVTRSFKRMLARRGRAIALMAGHELTGDDVTIANASLQYGLIVNGIWFEKLLAYDKNLDSETE